MKIARLRTLKATLDQNSAMTRTFLDAFGDLSQHDKTYERNTRQAITTIIGSLVDNQQLVEALRARIAENLAEGHFPSARQNASDDLIRLWRRGARPRTSQKAPGDEPDSPESRQISQIADDVENVTKKLKERLVESRSLTSSSTLPPDYLEAFERLCPGSDVCVYPLDDRCRRRTGTIGSWDGRRWSRCYHYTGSRIGRSVYHEPSLASRARHREA